MTVLVLCLLVSFQRSNASSTLPTATSDLFDDSAAVFRGRVVGIEIYRDENGLIFTRTSLRVLETLRGVCPTVIAVEHRGGQLDHEDQFFGLSPKLLPQAEYLLFVKRNAAGKLESVSGHASAFRLTHDVVAAPNYDSPGQEILTETRQLALAHPNSGGNVTDQPGEATILPLATTGMLGGVNTRFLQPDRGEPIPVLIDAASLPAGMTLAQATNAVIKALNAWTAVTSLKFTIESIGPFGQGADTITTADEKLRIQLHDNFNRINAATTLGIGGRSASSNPTGAGWNLGGNVAGNEFLKSTYGYVVLEATNSVMQNTNTFAEVLCHEIGHSLNMAHSSEVTTSDPLLQGSIMYFQAHADGRGATLGTYDPPVIRQCYPSNTVPYTFNRVLDVTTAPAAITAAGINELEIRGYDLQNTPLTLITNNQTSINGTFSLSGSTVKYTPGGYFSDSATRNDPDISSGSFTYRDAIFARFSDGTNASPYALIRVISFRGEATVSPDGIPDSWMNTYFGSATPAPGNLSRATDDADGDGLTNIQEYRAGSNPKDATSRLRFTTFTSNQLTFPAQAYELYEIQGTTNFVDWSVVRPVMPTNTAAVRVILPQTNILVTVTNLPTTTPRMFYRAEKVL